MTSSVVQNEPIELFYHPTPNGRKVTVMLEELEVPYVVRHVHIGRGDQFKPEFLAISPNNRIPAITDPEGPGGAPISVFESGAILLYLAEKFGRFYPTDFRERTQVNQWLMWQMGSFGPMLGQNHHFNEYAKDKIDYAMKRYTDEAHRLYRVLNTQLEGRDYICDEYTIVDMACIGWAMRNPIQRIDIEDFPNVTAWIRRMNDRPAVARGLAVTGQDPDAKPLSEDPEAARHMFGQR